MTEWVPLDNAVARKEITKRKRHFNVSKSSFISSVHSDAAMVNPRDVLIDESRQADIENLGDCLRVLGDGQTLGDFSLTIILYAAEKRTLDRVLPDVVRIFTGADGNLFSETYNQLNAYFAIVPGNYRHNLRKLFLLNSNYADISFLFTIHLGETWNEHLDREYLALLETDNATPYYLNLHEREPTPLFLVPPAPANRFSGNMHRGVCRRCNCPYRCLLSFTTEILAKAM